MYNKMRTLCHVLFAKLQRVLYNTLPRVETDRVGSQHGAIFFDRGAACLVHVLRC